VARRGFKAAHFRREQTRFYPTTEAERSPGRNAYRARFLDFSRRVIRSRWRTRASRSRNNEIESPGTPGTLSLSFAPTFHPFLLSRLNKVTSRPPGGGAGDSVSAVKRIPNALSAAINRRYSRRSIIPYPRASRGMHARLFTAPHRRRAVPRHATPRHATPHRSSSRP
jgi:hypothetical protein